ncbi:serine/threonine-protein kinase [Nostoc sp. CMAA1605]|uniref:serine/threonine-protein kinase n=1 Tax=Nostoc sp. CMAA1605 TaxID=2055159 RepID=UPI001F373F40|nr:serine/threonine-protein kinase [Nostoc sp. CMAA1605]MCF4968522.1 serine/threonine protein kinase [Nostoc sp. CMAA1605]
MKLCPHIGCLYSHNPTTAEVCLQCGKQLLLNHRYHLIRRIGQGGFGITFLAVDEQLPAKPWCVIKQFHFPSQYGRNYQQAVKLFRQEAVRLDGLQHRQIPKLLGYFEQENQLYLVEEWIPGQTLKEELQQNGVFREPQIQQLLKDLLPVLQFIHDKQIIHRDIKPANIIRHATTGELFLIDFGIAKHITATALLQTGTTIGSPEYMSPEQTRGKALPASDLYSLGVTCIHLLTDISPFDLFDVSCDRWVWRDYLLSRNTISKQLGEILDQMLQNAVSQRYKSAADVLQVLNTCPSTFQPQQSVNTLYSEVGVDYHKLRDLLAFKQWSLADQETWVVMCQALSKPTGSYFFMSDIAKLPCEDLQIIDQLWLKYSQGRFGFSIQKQIYERVECDYVRFCAAVGWHLYNSNSPPSWQFPLYQSFPEGNFPSRVWAGGTQWWRHIEAVGARLANCRLAEYSP